MKKVWFAGLLLGLASCAGNEMTANPAEVDVAYAETQCADPWLRPTNTSAIGYVADDMRATAILGYLKTNGVPSARDVRFQAPPPVGFNCQACTCPSGRTIRVTISSVDLENARKIGFKRE
jgi:hypothetical protein